MLRYLETFYRHRLLVIAPVLLALLASVAFAVSRPRTYEATAQLWFDPLTAAQAQQNGYLSPADQAPGELKELLKTHEFTSRVARRGTLYAAADAGSGKQGLTTRVVNLLRGVPSSVAGSPQVLDDVIFDTVNRDTVITTSGPQVVGISFDYPIPSVAATTAQAIVDQFTDELLGNRRTTAKAAVDFYTNQLQSQDAVVATADAAVTHYLQEHPDQRVPGALADSQLTALRRTDDLARNHYQDLLQKLDDARLEIAAASQPGAAGFRVVDTPTVPYRPKGFVKTAALAAGGGLMLGLLLALGMLVLLTAMDTSIHRSEEIPSDLSRRVAGTVPRLR